ncbi:MAG: radical SAM protein [Bacteroidales bacterium]|nr:radical SAM protein [Bacteroidales bacterium]MDD4030134.1 radical SAM protein [Bacteroidales bacterium]MDD4435527.1 radical SAM protein [Bacteroidales bacterium]
MMNDAPMTDSFGRQINYLRISVTDRCNLRCIYCMPAEGVPPVAHEQVLSYEEILAFTRYAVSRGINKVRLTGGEPLVRKGVTGLVHSLAAIEGIKDLAMTTNGILLTAMARELKEAGLHRLNISLDTLDPEKYRQLTRGGDLNTVLQGIRAAKQAGFGGAGAPLKLNCVLLPDTREEELDALRAFARKERLKLRLIQYMDLKSGSFSRVDGGDGGDCPRCNRLRLTSTGILKPCLFSNTGYDIRILGAEKALDTALLVKPASGTFNSCETFNYLGG